MCRSAWRSAARCPAAATTPGTRTCSGATPSPLATPARSSGTRDTRQAAPAVSVRYTQQKIFGKNQKLFNVGEKKLFDKNFEATLPTFSAKNVSYDPFHLSAVKTINFVMTGQITFKQK